MVVDFPAPFGPIKPSSSPIFHFKRQVAHGFDRGVLRLEQRAQAAAQSGSLALGLKCFLQVCNRDGWHAPIVFE